MTKPLDCHLPLNSWPCASLLGLTLLLMGACGRAGNNPAAGSQALGPCSVGGAIGEEYGRLGGEQSFLGGCTTNELPTPDGVGRFNHFLHGSIYWTPATGAHEVHGAIHDAWATLGWETAFGYPVTDEEATADGRGRHSEFERGSIAWSPQTQAHEVHGAIRDLWLSLGRESGVLGFPLSDEYTAGTDRRSDFEHGFITWNPGAGPVAHGIGDATRAPISVADEDLEKWVWVPIPNMRCADGSTSGVGVNFTKRSRDLVIFFEGNGVCYDALSCYADRDKLGGMGGNPLDHLFWGDATLPHSAVFDRADATNPLRASNFVVLPHCTGDFHIGNVDPTYAGTGTVHQHGYANVTEAIKRVVPTFKDAGRIVVAGDSAGGVGATFNYHQIASAFEAVGKPSPYLINDCGPLLSRFYLTDVGQTDMRNNWDLPSTVGTYCPECMSDGLERIWPKLAQLHRGLRSSLIAAYSDATVTQLYSVFDRNPAFTAFWLEQGLRDFSQWTPSYQASVAPSAQREFFYPSTRHCSLIFPLSQTPGLAGFLNAQLTNDPAWPTVRP